ncbi:type IV secretion system protein VirB9 [Skermanella aerolata]|uniref:TrbG/VirB9 family P-type conjugative transfer protein n=1 Tax=Skermanella aerolata TaxID=393310 RepID=UPI003D21057B
MIRALPPATVLVLTLAALQPAPAQEIPAIQPGAIDQAPATLPGNLPPAAMPGDAGTPGAEVPRHMPPQAPVLSPQKPLTGKQRAGVRMASTWISKTATPTLGEDGTVRFLFGLGEPSIVCAPLMVCDLALEPGEIVQPPLFLADHRWSAEPGVSGSGDSRTTHILLKPSDAGLTTNLVIHTNRRSYSIRLVSRTRDYMPLVAFDYPADTLARSWQQYATAMERGTPAEHPSSVCDQPPSIPPGAFAIEGDGVGWKPVQVYGVATPVGQKTCVQFPADIGDRSLPALLALGPGTGWLSGPSMEPVNARFTGGRFIVDGLLDRFALVDGVGSSQLKVIVERKP